MERATSMWSRTRLGRAIVRLADRLTRLSGFGPIKQRAPAETLFSRTLGCSGTCVAPNDLCTCGFLGFELLGNGYDFTQTTPEPSLTPSEEEVWARGLSSKYGIATPTVGEWE
jgi:hypothetical protein